MRPRPLLLLLLSLSCNISSTQDHCAQQSFHVCIENIAPSLLIHSLDAHHTKPLLSSLDGNSAWASTRRRVPSPQAASATRRKKRSPIPSAAKHPRCEEASHLRVLGEAMINNCPARSIHGRWARWIHSFPPE